MASVQRRLLACRSLGPRVLAPSTPAAKCPCTTSPHFQSSRCDIQNLVVRQGSVDRTEKLQLKVIRSDVGFDGINVEVEAATMPQRVQ